MMQKTKQIVNWRGLLKPLVSLLIGLLVGAVLMRLSGYDPLEVYKMMLQGAVGNKYSVMNTLQRSTPLMFTSLAVLVAARTGLFNMGVEGQLLIGAVTAAIVGTVWQGLPSLVHIILALGLGSLTGALWALTPALLKLRNGVNEVIVTLMMNTVATLLTSYLVNYSFREGPNVAQTARIAKSAELPRLVSYSQANVGIFIAIVFVAVFWFIFNKTTFGFRTKTLGEAPEFAESVGIHKFRTALMGMLISGAIAGFAGGIEVLGVYHRFQDPFAQGLGRDGILIAWLGRGTPIGAFFAALFYGGMKSGAMTVDWMTSIPRQLADTILALVIFFIATEEMFGWYSKLKLQLMSRGKDSNSEVAKDV